VGDMFGKSERADWEEGDLIRFNILRFGSNATYDTASGDAHFLACEVIFS